MWDIAQISGVIQIQNKQYGGGEAWRDSRHWNQNCWAISCHVISYLYLWTLSLHPQFPLWLVKFFVLTNEIIHGPSSPVCFSRLIFLFVLPAIPWSSTDNLSALSSMFHRGFHLYGPSFLWKKAEMYETFYWIKDHKLRVEKRSNAVYGRVKSVLENIVVFIERATWSHWWFMRKRIA